MTAPPPHPAPRRNSTRRRWLVPTLGFGLAAVLVAGVLVGRWYLREEAGRRLKASVAAWPGGWELHYTDLAVGWREPRIRLSGVQLQARASSPALRAAKAEVFGAATYQARRDLVIALHGWQLVSPGASSSPTGNHALAGLTPHPPGEARLRLVERAPETVVLRAWVSSPEWGELTLAVELGHLSVARLAAAAANPWQMPFTLAGSAMVQGDVRYADQGLGERLLHLAALRRGVPAEDLRQALVADLERRSRAAPSTPLGNLLAALRDFVARPGRIRIQAAPDAPVALGGLLWHPQPEVWAERLGITAAHAPQPPEAAPQGPPPGLLPGDP
jgi:hypothetical protein